MDGLLWGACKFLYMLYNWVIDGIIAKLTVYLLVFDGRAAKLVPVGYGIKKLQIMMTIVDDLVSVDSLIEEHLTVEPANEYIQSCDIVAFNKICKYLISYHVAFSNKMDLINVSTFQYHISV